MHLSKGHPDLAHSPTDRANRLFALARSRARRGQLWSRLTGRARSLLALKDATAACTIRFESDGEIRTVPIGEIRGSEGRSRYFDRDFNPLHDQARGRWLNIARARQQGAALPPVQLVRIGEVYFVRDGHHRISVARALGQADIEGRVSVWQVSGPLPWELEPRKPGRRLAEPLPAGERPAAASPAA